MGWGGGCSPGIPWVFHDGQEHSQGSRQVKGPPLALGVTPGSGVGHRQELRHC